MADHSQTCASNKKVTVVNTVVCTCSGILNGGGVAYGDAPPLPHGRRPLFLWSICSIVFYNLCKFSYFSDVKKNKICYSFGGTFSPRLPTGTPHWDHAGGIPSPRPTDLASPPELNSKYTTVCVQQRHDVLSRADWSRQRPAWGEHDLHKRYELSWIITISQPKRSAAEPAVTS